MERRKKNKYRKNLNTGPFYMGKGRETRIIKPGQAFEAFPEEVPTAFLDTITLIEDEGGSEDAHDKTGTPVYKAVHKGGGKWIVITIETDKKMNEGYLTKKDAKKLVESLS